MPIKVFIKRTVRPDNLKEVSRFLIKSRSAAMAQSGYISSETLSNCDDPNQIMVSSMWDGIDAWEFWKGSDERKALEAEFENILEGPADYEAYNLGL